MPKKKSEKEAANPDAVEIDIESDDNQSSVKKSASKSSGGPDGGDEQALREELEHVSQQLTDSRESQLRTAAELQNLRKRNAAELEKARKYAIDGFAKSLLEVMESLDRACEVNADVDIETMREGVELTRKQLLSVFERASIRKISVQAGDAFNVNEHEAMTLIPTADFPPNHVVEVFRAGYMIHDRLLQAAMVIVSAEQPAVEAAADAERAAAENSEIN